MSSIFDDARRRWTTSLSRSAPATRARRYSRMSLRLSFPRFPQRPQASPFSRGVTGRTRAPPRKLTKGAEASYAADPSSEESAAPSPAAKDPSDACSGAALRFGRRESLAILSSSVASVAVVLPARGAAPPRVRCRPLCCLAQQAGNSLSLWWSRWRWFLCL